MNLTNVVAIESEKDLQIWISNQSTQAQALSEFLLFWIGFIHSVASKSSNLFSCRHHHLLFPSLLLPLVRFSYFYRRKFTKALRSHLLLSCCNLKQASISQFSPSSCSDPESFVWNYFEVLFLLKSRIFNYTLQTDRYLVSRFHYLFQTDRQTFSFTLIIYFQKV